MVPMRVRALSRTFLPDHVTESFLRPAARGPHHFGKGTRKNEEIGRGSVLLRRSAKPEACATRSTNYDQSYP